MEKFLAARNEKVRAAIPDDLAFSILSKLPLKSLKRFECGSKSWALLSENPHFMSMFRKNFIKNHSSYNDTSLLLHQTMTTNQKFALYSLSAEGFESRSKLDWPNPFLGDDPGFDILGYSSVNGILGLISYSQLNNIRVILWNPTTKEFKVIPPRPLESVPHIKVEVDRHGFGYDCVRDDYMVIQRVTYLPKVDSDIDMLPLGNIYYDPFWEIYSLRSNSWKKIRSDDMTTYDYQGVYVGGACHWWGEYKYTNEQYLVSFDFSNEVSIETPIPSFEDDSSGFGSMWSHLVVLSGSIALITTYANMTTSHISILGELGVKKSWTKIFTVGVFSYLDEYPIAAGKNGDIFFRKKNGKLASFDLSTQMIKEHGVIVDSYCCKIVLYKENLLPIGGNN